MSYRILQLTDLHLFADREQRLRSVATWPRFASTLAAIRSQFPDIDLVVITGDIAHDEERATYEAVREILGDWCKRTLVLPGNHDDRQSLMDVFPGSGDALPGRVMFTVAAGEWHLLGLDSQITGQVPGELGDGQLQWLREQLTAAADKQVVLFMHHPPVNVGSSWIDPLRLQDADRLLKLLAEFNHIALVCCGHVHQESTASIAGTTVFTTPAVGPQFVPRVDDLVIDDLPPGTRLIELHDDGSWTTQVLRFATAATEQSP